MAFRQYTSGTTSGRCSSCRFFDLDAFTVWVNEGSREAVETYNALRQRLGSSAMVDIGVCEAATKARGETVVSKRDGGCNSAIGIFYEPRMGFDDAMGGDLFKTQTDEEEKAAAALRAVEAKNRMELDRLVPKLQELERLAAGNPELVDEATREAVEATCKRVEKLGDALGDWGAKELVRNVRRLLAQRRLKPEPSLDLDRLRKRIEDGKQKQADEAIEDLTRVGKRVIE